MTTEDRLLKEKVTTDGQFLEICSLQMTIGFHGKTRQIIRIFRTRQLADY
jgi:hypothetical protein